MCVLNEQFLFVEMIRALWPSLKASMPDIAPQLLLYFQSLLLSPN